MTGFVEVGMQRRLRSELLQRRDALRAELQQVRTQLAVNELWLRQHSILVKRHKAERVACDAGVSAGLAGELSVESVNNVVLLTPATNLPK